MKVYDDTAQAWKDAEMLRKYDDTAQAWKDCECALRHNGEAWEEVWSSAPSNALIWNYKVISDELTEYSVSSAVTGEIITNSYTNLQIKSGHYNDYYRNRISLSLQFNEFIVPTGASNIVMDIDTEYIRGDYDLSANTFRIQTKDDGTYVDEAIVSVPTNFNVSIPIANYTVSNCLGINLSMHTGADKSILSSPFYVTVRIKNMYFE